MAHLNKAGLKPMQHLCAGATCGHAAHIAVGASSHSARAKNLRAEVPLDTCLMLQWI